MDVLFKPNKHGTVFQTDTFFHSFVGVIIPFENVHNVFGKC